MPSRRSWIGLASQLIASAGNFAVTYLTVRQGDGRAIAAVGVAVAAYRIATLVVRAAIGEPWLFERRDSLDVGRPFAVPARVLAESLGGGLVVTIPFVALGISHFRSWTAAVPAVLGVALVVVVELLRFVLQALSRTSELLAIDVLWTVGGLAAGAALQSLWHTGPLSWMWGWLLVGSAVSAGAFARATQSAERPTGGRRRRNVALALSDRIGFQGFGLLAPVATTADEYAALAAPRDVLGFANPFVLYFSARLAGREPSSRRRHRIAVALLSAVPLASALVIHVLPHGASDALFASGGDLVQRSVIPIGLALACASLHQLIGVGWRRDRAPVRALGSIVPCVALTSTAVALLWFDVVSAPAGALVASAGCLTIALASTPRGRRPPAPPPLTTSER